MKNHFISLFIIIVSINYGTSQNISISSGAGINHYRTFDNDNFNTEEFHIGGSQFLKVDFTDIGDNLFLSNMSIDFKRSIGTILLRDHSRTCGIFSNPSEIMNTSEEINKFELSIGTYPIDINITDHIKLRAGIQLTKVINSYHSYNNPNKPINKRTPDFGEFESQLIAKSFSSDALIEIQFKRFSIGNNMTLYPLYSGNFGFTPEFDGRTKVYSMQHYIGLAIEWQSIKK